MMKNSKIAFFMISIVFASSVWAKEKTTVLTVHHFMSQNSPVHAKFLVSWADRLYKKSNGKIKIEIFPSMTMGGKPNELYKQVRDGAADIVWTLAGYTSGVFPRTEVYELPTVHKGSPIDTNIAIKENFHLIENDFKDVKPLLVHVHAGASLHVRDRKINSIGDVKGLKLRIPSRTGGWMIEEMGAEPVGMPLPDFPQALSKGVVDGGTMPFEVFPPFKFQQLTKYSTLGEDGTRFGTSVFLLLMNKDTYSNLSKELQDYIDQSIGMDTVIEVGKIWMNVENIGMRLQEETPGNEVVKLNQKEMLEFNKAGQRVVDRWIKEVNSKGIDGQLLVDKAREAISKNTK